MIFYILAASGIMFLVSVGFGTLMAMLDDDATDRSLLYDDPEYFKHEEPEWLRKDDEE